MQATQHSSIGGYNPLTGLRAVVAAAALVVAVVVAAILTFAGGHGIGTGAPAAGAAPRAATFSAAQVDAALVEIRRGEREPLSATAGSTKAQVDAALVEIRRGEREPLFGMGGGSALKPR